MAYIWEFVMYGLKKRQKDESGLIQGAGTGTSDDVKKNVPAGSYIMPADSTQQIGTDNLKNMGSPTPVNLSNGEFQLSPDQVHSVGVQTLDAMKNQTHVPVDQPQLGFKPGQNKPELFFANGGLVPSAYPSADDIRRAQQNRVGGPQMRDVSGITRDVNRSLPSTTINTPSTTSAPSTSPVNPASAQGEGFGARMLGNIGNMAKGLGRFHVASAGLGGAYTGMQTPTEDYRERFGMETDHPTLIGDLGVRALGVLSDVGNSASFGILGRNFADKQRINAESANTAQQKQYAAHNTNKQAVPVEPPSNATSKPSIDHEINNALYGDDKSSVPQQVPSNHPTPTTQQLPRNNNNPYAVQQNGHAFSYANPSAAAQARANGVPETSTSGFVNVKPVDDTKGVANLMANTREMGASQDMIDQAFNLRVNNLGMQGYAGRPRLSDVRTPEQEAQLQSEIARVSTPIAGSKGLTASQRNQINDLQMGYSNRATDVYKTDANNATSQFNNSMNNATSIANNRSDNAANIAQTGMREQGANTRAMLNEQGQNGRFNAQLGFDAQKFNATNDLANREFNLNAAEKGSDIRNSQRIEKLYEMYDKATTDEDKATIQQRINRYTGGDKANGRDRYMTVGGGQEWNEASGMMINRPQQLFDTQTQQYLNAQPTQQQTGHKGSFEEGKVYTDANGNKAVYRNGQFQSVG